MAVSCAVSPTANESDVLSRVTDPVGTVTVTTHSAVLSPHLAVIVAFPALTAVTLPSATLATDSSEDVQVTFLSVASSGFTVAVNVAVSPTANVRVALSRVTDPVGTVTVTAHSAVLSPHLAVMATFPALTAVTIPLSTFATDSSEEVQDTFLSVASSGLTVAISCAVSPTANESDVLSRVTEPVGTVTVTAHSAVLSPHLAVMATFPALTAVTIPLSTFATDSSEEVQDTFLSVASSGLTVAISCAVSPTANESDVLSRVTEPVGTVTVTAHSAVLPPHLAVIVALPDLTAVTLPSATLATDSSEDAHATFLSDASSGFTVAVNVAVSPTAKERAVLSSVTDSTSTEIFTVHSAMQEPDFAVIIAVPDFFAVTLPSDTVATETSDDPQVTDLSAALAGLTVAVIVSVSPTFIDNEILSRVIDVTATTFVETFTVQVADLPPALAVIVAVPSLMAVTVPEFTLATEALDEAQVTPSYSASFGRTVATRLKVSPSTISIVAVFNDTDDTST